MKLSVIIPCKNEEKNLDNLYERLNNTLKNIKYEAIFVDDGSSDNTLNKLKEIYDKDVKHVKVISFSRNFRKEAAMLAGLKHASGEYTAIIDGDLQQNPDYLLQMIELLDSDSFYDEVAMVMSERKEDSKFMSFCKDKFYKLMNSLCDIKLENAASDFRMFRSNVRDAVLSLSEKNRFSKGIFAWIGFNVKYLPYEVQPRANGKSSFGFKNSMRYALEGILAFSQKPLKWPIGIGLFTMLADLIYLVVMIILTINSFNPWNGINISLLIVLLLFSIQFIFIGILGVYLSTINSEVKNRPSYLIKEKLGFNDETIL